MNRLTAENVTAFRERFDFRGGTLADIRLTRPVAADAGAIVVLSGYEQLPDGAEHPVTLRLELEGVEEYRFQRRPAGGRP